MVLIKYIDWLIDSSHQSLLVWVFGNPGTLGTGTTEITKELRELQELGELRIISQSLIKFYSQVPFFKNT